jgi:pyridoxal phosphate enzyme (YggS family)
VQQNQVQQDEMTGGAMIGDTLNAVRRDIAGAARQAGRNPENVTLVAVSKTHGAEAVLAAIAAGQRVFGENRVQEAKGKFTDLKAVHRDLELHLIGPLQTNKAKEAVALFDVIQSLDRPKLARALADEMARTGCRPRLLVQVNIGQESQKAGVLPEDVDGFLSFCREECGLAIEGLMCIPPVGKDAAPYFRALADMAARHGLAALSMGMSGDYPTAIRLGATHVRIGTGIFGQRAGYPVGAPAGTPVSRPANTLD